MRKTVGLSHPGDGVLFVERSSELLVYASLIQHFLYVSVSQLLWFKLTDLEVQKVLEEA